jgi:diguanylate cyclase (GGDEF)-like protein
MDRADFDASSSRGDGTRGDRSRRHRRLLGALSLSILLVGATASILGGLAWTSYVHDQSGRAFSSTAQTEADALSVAMQRDADLTATARTLIETTPTLTNAQFSTWFRLLGTRNSYPGSFGLIFIANVQQSELAGFAHHAAVDPPLGLAMSGPFALSPSSSRAPYCLTRAGVVQLSQTMGMSMTSLAGLLAFTAPDLNYCGLPIGTLLHQSADTGQAAAVTLASLIAESPHMTGVPNVPASLPGFLAKNGLITTLTPIYAGGTVPATRAARTASLTGWIFGIYQADNILAPVIQGRHGSSAALYYVNPSGNRSLLASSGTAASGALTRTFRLAAAGQWYVTLSGPGTASGLSAGAQGVAIALGGLVLSLLLFVLIRVLSRSRAKALQLVEERTAQLRHQALHDGLTALPNRALIFDRAEQMLARARRDGSDLAALFIDLDRFKDINDTFGHDAGDELLRQVSARFAAALRETDTVGRLGGDEFVVLVEEVHGAPDPVRVADDLIASLREPFSLSSSREQVRSVTASIGIASGVRDSAGELLRDADIALYEAKASARGGHVVFHEAMHSAIATRLELESELRDALRRGEFFLAYQPTFSLTDQTMTGAEALLRWRHPTRGIVMPGEIIPTLESTGLILEVGRFVLETACHDAAAWAESGHPMTVSVNASGRQLDRSDFITVVQHALDSSGLSPQSLTIEITETTLMRDTELSTLRLRALKQLGINLAIDDFGTGYCSLAYLQQFPVDSLKIDQSFVSLMETSPEGAALIHTIVQMGRDLNLETLAEGIETPAQLARLRLEECTNGQGFLFARPLEVSALDDLIASLPRPVERTLDPSISPS